MTGSAGTSSGGRRTALLLLAVLVAAGALVLVLVGVIGWGSRDPATTTQSSQTLTLPRPEQTAPPAAVRPIHRALHTLGSVCKPGDDTKQTSRARPPLEVILDFARRYPNVSFPIHDETGTTLSLLFVARDSVRSCAPTLMPRVERLIPSEYLTPNGPDE